MAHERPNSKIPILKTIAPEYPETVIPSSSEQPDDMVAPETVVVSTETVPSAPVPTTALSLTLEQLQQLINTAVTAAVQASGQNPNLGKEIGAAVAAGIAANAPRRKVTLGEYDPKTYVQPDKSKTLRLRRKSYQNGGLMEPVQLSNPEIDLLNRITHSGRYINRLVEVIVGLDGTEEFVNLRYNNKTPDHRMQLKGHARNLEDMLRQIVEAQEVEDREEADMQEVRDRLRREVQANRQPATV